MTTAKEIFYIWIVRMIILGKYFTGKIPFEKVIITPTILDEKGRKMSKSLGNGLDPVVAIDQFSSDSLRLAMLGGMIPNRNMKMGGKLAENIMQKYRNFGNKIWNVARFLEGKEGEKKQDFDIK
jgi:valyl-tRNA synthetase